MLWRGGGEADGVLAAKHASDACDMMKKDMGKKVEQEKMLALADGLHVRFASDSWKHTSHVTRHTSHIAHHTSHVTRHTSHTIRYT